MSFTGSVRDICRKIGVGRLLAIGLAGVVLVVCSLDFESIFAGDTESRTDQTDSGAASDGAGGGSGTNASDAAAEISALTDVFDAQTEESLSMQELEARLEARLAELLSQMEGVGEVTVMVTLSSGTGKEILKDEDVSKDDVTESDSAGGSRQSISYDQSEDTVMDSAEGSSAQTPYVLKYLAPEICGVAVVAQGGGDAQVVAQITELVAALFDLDVTQISVAQMK